MSLIQFQPEALANTVVQDKAFKHRSDRVAPRAHTLPRDSTPCHYPAPLHTQLIPTGCSSSRGLCPLLYYPSSAVVCASRRTKFCIPALLWPRRFTMMLCAIWVRALLCSCSACTACSQINQALMVSG